MGEPKSKKRKRDNPKSANNNNNNNDLDTSKPTAIFQASSKGRSSTLSIALPGSIIANCQSHDLRTALAGRIARALAVFCIDEIIIFNDGQTPSPKTPHPKYGGGGRDFEHDPQYTGLSDPSHFLFHLLSYLECPPHLRVRLFPLHPNLKTAGASPSLDMPHHLRPDEWCRYREGVSAGSSSDPGTSLVDVGFPEPVVVDEEIPENTRVTIDFGSHAAPVGFPFKGTKIPPAAAALANAEAVDPAEPREKGGYYWGYTVRSAASLSAVFTEAPFGDGYDVSIGTSERGVSLADVLHTQTKPADSANGTSGAKLKLPSTYKHALVVFGGVAGLEAAAVADADLVAKGIGKETVGELFDFWVNSCAGQGSRTIRTEEAVWITLSQLHAWAQAASV